MIRALQLAEYFYNAAEDTYRFVDTNKTVPEDVLFLATLWKKGQTFSQIAINMYGDKKHKTKVHRMFKKMIVEYPKQFNSEK